MATVVKDLGAVTAYAYAVAGGYSGTEAEFEALLGNIAEDLSEIENLSVTVTTLPAGSSATASYNNGVLSLGIPKGDKGDKGDTGATGATGATGPQGIPGDVANLASAYSTSSTYGVGDYCIYNSQLYRCTTPITTAEAWTAGHWTAAVLGDDVSDLKSALNGMTTATAEDEGKALKAKTVSGGKVTEWEFGDTASIDPTLSQTGEAAEAKATGDWLKIVSINCLAGEAAPTAVLKKASAGARIAAVAESSVSIIHAGKNLFSFDRTRQDVPYSTNTTMRILDPAKYYVGITANNYGNKGNVSAVTVGSSSITTTGTYGVGFPIKVVAGTTYIINGQVDDTENNNMGVQVGFYSSDGTHLSNVRIKGLNGSKSACVVGTFTAPEGAVIADIVFIGGANGAKVKNVMVSIDGATMPSTSVSFEDQYQLEAVYVPYAGIDEYVGTAYVGNAYGAEDTLVATGNISVSYVESTKQYIDAGLEAKTDKNATDAINEAIGDWTYTGGYIPNTDFVVDGEALDSYYQKFDVTGDLDSYIFFTDPHTAHDSVTPAVIRLLFESLRQYGNRIPGFVCCGGDWLQSYDTHSEALNQTQAWAAAAKIIPDYFPVLGNHDDANLDYAPGSSSTLQAFSRGTVDGLMFAKYGGKAYYSFEYGETNHFVFDTGSGLTLAQANIMTDYRKAQIKWFISSLLENKKPHVMAFMHWFWFGANRDIPTTIPQNVVNIANAFNDRDTFTFDGETYDFANATGKFEYIMSGHTHEDYTDVVDGIRVIASLNALPDRETPTFDLVLVDYLGEKVYCIRIGSGDNRTISL